MTQIKDGWHKVYGEDVYVENGKGYMKCYFLQTIS